MQKDSNVSAQNDKPFKFREKLLGLKFDKDKWQQGLQEEMEEARQDESRGV